MQDVATIGQDLSREKVELIKQTVAKGATDLELELFLHACKRTGLDPLMKQIYAIKRWNAKSQKEEMAIQTGIDGYRLIADRTGNYAPGQKPTFVVSPAGTLISATAYVKKMTEDGAWHVVEGEAFYDEYVQRTKSGEVTAMWQKGRTMLAKCAESLALRRAFPAELSGVYTHEEMMQADNHVEAKPAMMDHKRTAQAKIQELREQPQGQDAGPRLDTVGGKATDPPQASDSPAAILDDYLTKIDLSQSVSEVSVLLNAAVKDERLDVFQVQKVQDVAKVKIVALRKGK